MQFFEHQIRSSINTKQMIYNAQIIFTQSNIYKAIHWHLLFSKNQLLLKVFSCLVEPDRNYFFVEQLMMENCLCFVASKAISLSFQYFIRSFARSLGIEVFEQRVQLLHRISQELVLLLFSLQEDVIFILGERVLQVLFQFIILVYVTMKHELLAKLFKVLQFQSQNVEHASFSESSQLAHDELLHGSIILSEDALQELFQSKYDVMVRYVKLEPRIKDWFRYVEYFHVQFIHFGQVQFEHKFKDADFPKVFLKVLLLIMNHNNQHVWLVSIPDIFIKLILDLTIRAHLQEIILLFQFISLLQLYGFGDPRVLKLGNALLIKLRVFSNSMIIDQLFIIAVVMYGFMSTEQAVQIVDEVYLVEWRCVVSLQNVLMVKVRQYLAQLD